MLKITTVKTLSSIYLFLLSYTVSAQVKSPIQYKSYWPNGLVNTITYNDGVYNQGIWNLYDSTGSLIQQDKFINGNKFYLNKWVNGNQTIIDGNGELTEYYINGVLKSYGKIKKGKKYGLWHQYYINGNIESIIEYVEWEGIYKSELEYHAKLIASFDSTGNIIGSKGSGIILKIDSTGLIVEKSFYTNNFKDSMHIYYNTGLIKSIQLVNKTMHIEWERASYYPNGFICYEMLNSLDTVILKSYYPNGQLKKIVKSFKDSEYRIYYNFNGEILKEETCTVTFILNDNFEEYCVFDCVTK